MMNKRKTYDTWITQGNYGYGWEDVDTNLSRVDGRQSLKTYRSNDTQHCYRLLKKRVHYAKI